MHTCEFWVGTFPPPVYQRGARDRKPVRIAVDFLLSIGSLVDPRHFSDKNSTHAVVGTECRACLSIRRRRRGRWHGQLSHSPAGLIALITGTCDDWTSAVSRIGAGALGGTSLAEVLPLST
eukprot:scaffold57344_cov69-Phaeocystis_antarctica.AAC.2